MDQRRRLRLISTTEAEQKATEIESYIDRAEAMASSFGYDLLRKSQLTDDWITRKEWGEVQSQLDDMMCTVENLLEVCSSISRAKESLNECERSL